MSATFVSPIASPAPHRGWFCAAVLVGAPIVNLCLAFVVMAAMGSDVWAADGTFALIAGSVAVAANILILAPLAARADWGWLAVLTGTAAAMVLSVGYAYAVIITFFVIACAGADPCLS